MKKLVNYILVVTTSLLLLSCEKEKYPGAYPYDEIIFNSSRKYVPIKYSSSIINLEVVENWNKELYPMSFWVDNEDIATISQDGILTGKAKGIVTIYAEVMGVRRQLKSSVQYYVGENLTQLNDNDLKQLINAGFDVNNDTRISIAELSNATSTQKHISDELFFKILPYIEKLDTLDLIVFNNSLDLSNIKIKKLDIYDGNFRWTYEYGDSIYMENTYKEFLEPYVLKELKLNSDLEEFSFRELPGIPVVDLRYLTSLKKITRHYFDAWRIRDCTILPPTSIEYIQVNGCNVQFDDVYQNLHTYHYSSPNQYLVVLSKDHLPNLKNIIYKSKSFKLEFMYGGLDISSYEAGDIDFLSVKDLMLIHVSQSIYDAMWSSIAGNVFKTVIK